MFSKGFECGCGRVVALTGQAQHPNPQTKPAVNNATSNGKQKPTKQPPETPNVISQEFLRKQSIAINYNHGATLQT